MKSTELSVRRNASSFSSYQKFFNIHYFVETKKRAFVYADNLGVTVVDDD